MAHYVNIAGFKMKSAAVPWDHPHAQYLHDGDNVVPGDIPGAKNIRLTGRSFAAATSEESFSAMFDFL